MDHSTDIAFAWADSWLLTALSSLHGTPGSVDLQAIIAAADEINRAIISYDELNDGLARLIVAGYVIFNHETFSLGPQIIKLVNGMGQQEGAIKMLEKFEDFLGVRTIKAPNLRAPKYAQPTISPLDYQTAVQAYLETF